MKLLGILYRHHVLDIFHHTDGGSVAMGICTNRTDVCVADIMAYMTVFHAMFEFLDGIGKLLNIGIVLTKHPQH